MAAGVYLHIPFCKSRCSYCDFATDVYRDNGAVERYVDALCAEIGAWQPAEGVTQDVDTVYFGGGTPSLLTADQTGRILRSVREKFVIAPDAEITMEMNPATVSPETLGAYRDLGVNRASFGVQTFDDRDLKLLARGHDANDARQTFRMLRDAGFRNISFDLIAGLPGQTIDNWRRNLDEAIELGPEHMSLYLLEVHESTPLAGQLRSGRRPMPDEDAAAEMYEIMLDRLSAEGYEQYEISNFARPGFASRHNTKYWRLDPVYGFGVSAHSFDGRDRYANERDTRKYIDLAANGHPEISRTVLSPDMLAGEFIFLNLRLNAGLSPREYSARFGRNIFEQRAAELAELASDGLIVVTDENIRLTRRGMLYSNNVFSAFI
jgi:oxygen-independent coproporphyrinogen-3 oxidase